MRKVVNMIAATLMLASMGSALATEKSCVYPAKIRDFSVESSGSVVVRQAKDTYFRLKVDEQCSLDQAVNKVGLDNGFSSWIANSNVRVLNNSVVQRICPQTPHAKLIFLSKNSTERGSCKLVGIEPVTKGEFEAVGPTQTNRAF